MNQLQVFNSEEFGQVRTVEVNGEPYLIASDVAKSLGYSNPRDAIARHVDAEDKEVVNHDTPGGQQTMVAINESGMYALVFGSKLESAKRFKHWVTGEVLPSIRKTGVYVKPLTTEEKIKAIAQGNVELSEKIEEVKTDLEEFKQDLPLLGCDMDRITTAVKKMGVKCLGGKDTQAYKDKPLRSKVYMDIYDQLKREFGVSSYKSIKRNQCDTAVRIIENYQLPMILTEEIMDCNAQEEIFV